MTGQQGPPGQAVPAAHQTVECRSYTLNGGKCPLNKPAIQSLGPVTGS